MALNLKKTAALCSAIIAVSACRPPDAPTGSVQSIGSNFFKAEISQRAQLSCRDSMIHNIGLFSELLSRTTQSQGIKQLKLLQTELENLSLSKITAQNTSEKPEAANRFSPFQWCTNLANQSEPARKAQEFNLNALEKRMISSSLHFATAIELQSIARDRIAYALTGRASGLHVTAIEYHITDDLSWIDESRNALLVGYLKIWSEIKKDAKNKEWDNLKSYSEKLVTLSGERKIDFKISAIENKNRQEQSQKAMESIFTTQSPQILKENTDKLINLLR